MREKGTRAQIDLEQYSKSLDALLSKGARGGSRGRKKPANEYYDDYDEEQLLPPPRAPSKPSSKMDSGLKLQSSSSKPIGWINTVLMGGLATCAVLLIILSIKLQSKAAMMDDCVRKTGAFRFELDTTKEQLFSTRTKLRELDLEKGSLKAELETASTKLAKLRDVKTTLKTELEKLISKYQELKQEKNTIATQFELSRAETKQLEVQSQQLEKLLGHLHNGIRALENNGVQA